MIEPASQTDSTTVDTRFPLVIRVGFTGHMDLTDVDVKDLRRRIGAGLNAILDSARPITTDNPDILESEPRIELITGLARGADLCAAEVAVERGIRLIALSPFSWDEFERDFDGAPKELERAQRLWKMEGIDRIEFAEDPPRKPTAGATIFDLGAPGYARLGRFIVDHADIVLAFVDPARPPGGTGGTSWVIDEATRAGRPVISISPSGGANSPLEAKIPDKLEKSLAGAFSPPETVRRLPPSSDGHSHSKKTTSLTGDYLEEALRDPFSHESVSLPFFPQILKWYGEIFDGLVRRLGGRCEHACQPREVDLKPLVPPALLQEQRIADRLAGFYNGLHRSTFFFIYVLGFLAVLFAVLGHLDVIVGRPESHEATKAVESDREPTGPVRQPDVQAGEERDPTRPVSANEPLPDSKPSEGSGDRRPSVGVALTAFEILSLALIVTLFRLSRNKRWREKGTDYRLLGELFRASIGLWPLRARMQFGTPRAQGSDGEVNVSWMAWYAVAVTRDAGDFSTTFSRPHVALCRDTLVDGVLLDQLRYHQTRTHRFLRIERMLNWTVGVLFALAVIGCIAHGLHLIPLSSYSLVLTAALPALATALHGIASHAEFARLERRYSAMARYFQKEIDDLEELERPVPPATSGRVELGRADLVPIARRVTSRMIDEAAEWRWLHDVHDAKI